MATGDGHYIAVADVTWPAAWTAAQKAASIVRAEELIERVTRDVFYAKSVTLTLDGNGRRILMTGQRQALLAVQSITFVEPDGTEEVYDGDVAAGEWSIGIFGIFPEGLANIRIACTMGWTVTPQAIEDAAKVLCEADAVPTSHARADFASERIGDYSYSRDTAEGKAAGVPILTGIIDADRLLKDYVRHAPAIGVV